MKNVLLITLISLALISCKKEEVSTACDDAIIVPVNVYDTILNGMRFHTDNTFQPQMGGAGGATLIHHIGDDIFIDGKTYKIVDQEVWPHNDNPYTDYEYGYVRVDSETNKAYWLASGQATEQELFDFNLNIGTSYQNAFTGLDIIVDSISEIAFGPETFSVYHCTPTVPFGHQTEIEISPLFLSSAGMFGFGPVEFQSPSATITQSHSGSASKHNIMLGSWGLMY